jgi:predicted Zn-dependent protease
VSEHLFAPNFEWKIWLIDDPTIANATCFPGGKIVVYTGILDKIDAAVEKNLCFHQYDAFAVVLSHEIAHALARHSAERLSYLPLDFILGFFSSDHPFLQMLYQLGKVLN